MPSLARAACRPDLTLRWWDPYRRPAAGRLDPDSPVLRVPPFLTNPGMISVGRATNRLGSPVVRLRFAPEAAEVMAQESAAQPNATLVIMLDGSVVAAPVVRDPISDKADIETGDAAEADRVALDLQRWLETCRRPDAKP